MTLATELPDFRLEVHFARWEFAARHHLTASDAETLTVGELLEFDGAQDRLERLPLGYTPTWGGEQLRAAIAATYEQVAPEQVLCFAGAQEAIFWAMQVLVGPGEHAVVTVPNYQSMESVPRAAGCSVDALPLDPADDWRIDLDRLKALLRPATRLVASTSPTTPPVPCQVVRRSRSSWLSARSAASAC